MGLLKKRWSSLQRGLLGKPPKFDSSTSLKHENKVPRRTFLDLPVELIETITKISDSRVILALRLVCRNLHAKTETSFGEAFFATLETDLSLKDMKQIEALASRENLWGYVKTLSISVKVPIFRSQSNIGSVNLGSGNWQLNHMLGIGHQWPRTIDGDLEEDILLIGYMGHLLTEKFVNCKSFCVHDTEIANLQMPNRQDFITSVDAVTILLQIITTYQIEVISFDVKFGWGITSDHVDAMQLWPKQWKFELSQPPWSRSLDALYLVFPQFSPTYHPLAIELIAAAKSLRTLKLELDSNSKHDTFLRDLSNNFSAPLKEIVLFKVHIPEGTLVGFLQNFSKTISSLALCQVRLSEGSWRSVLRILRDGARSEQFPAMESIALFNLMGPHIISDTRTYFCALRKNPFLPGSDERIEMVEIFSYCAVRTAAVRYRGSNIGVALDVLAKAVYPLHLDRDIMLRPGAIEDVDTSMLLLKDFSIDKYRW